jgi:hypothetical protein
VPLAKIQSDILRLLAAHRDPESYVGGSPPLNRPTSRFSRDSDVFHDREERVAQAAEADGEWLCVAGYEVGWMRRDPGTYAAVASRAAEATSLEWVADSDFRFFPTVPDELFGYILHPVDLATNKVMAAAGRREVRDLFDLTAIHREILPLGAVIWAAIEKSPGFTPEGLIAEIRRNSNYPAAEWRAILTSEPFDPDAIVKELRGALDDAEAFVARMPTAKAGLLFLDGGRVVQPDPDRLDSYEVHAGQKRGHWPTNPEIAAAMLERYRRPHS